MISALSRRRFLRIAGGSAAAVGFGGLPSSLSGVRSGGRGAWDERWNPLRRALECEPRALTLTASPGTADIGGGVLSPALMINDSLPSPLLRVRRGDPFHVTLRNELPRDELILHWHGLTPPESGDGHPRLAVGSGESYDYRFAVENRAGTYWYHSHAHHLVAKHTYLGIAGMLIVEDDEEEALGLPSGEREVAIILQDRTLGRTGHLTYHDPNLLGGHTGTDPFGNGVRRPYLEVDSALYRFRVLNGSNARVFRLESSDGRPLVVIGNDGGLLPRSVPLAYADIAPGERLDLLVDLAGAAVGDTILLRSRAFEMPHGMEDVLDGASSQGVAVDLVQLRVTRTVREKAPVPERLCSVVAPDAADAVRERLFLFASDTDPATRGTHIRHRINGRTYDMDRIDEHVPFGETEIWTFRNDLRFPHPVHVHGTHFRVLSREGGRGRVMPWEEGLKDTVLLHPTETVRVAVRFTAHRGLFLLHCHNLEHEDVGMMANLLVE